MSSPTYPRIECLAEGCRRGTSTLPPGGWMVCAKHWRMVPKSWKRRLNLIRRRWRKAERMQDWGKCAHCHRLHSKMLKRIRQLFDYEHEGKEMPLAMREELRDIAIL